MKSQVLVNQKMKEIACTVVRKGKVHDFRIWKESQIEMGKKTEILADKGYQGIKKIHEACAPSSAVAAELQLKRLEKSL